MRAGLTLLVAGFVFAGAHAAVPQSTQVSEPGPLSLTIRAVKEVVEAGSPVVVRVTATNISDHLARWTKRGQEALF